MADWLWWLVAAMSLAGIMLGAYFSDFGAGLVADWLVPKDEEAEPIITPPPKNSKPWEAPELQPIPFDAKAYRKAEIAKQVAELRPYTANTPCAKCGARGNPDPHNAKLDYRYFVSPHSTETQNEQRAEKRRELQYPNSYLYGMMMSFPDHLHYGPGYIRRSCFKCGYKWNELALDEVKAAAVSGDTRNG